MNNTDRLLHFYRMFELTPYYAIPNLTNKFILGYSLYDRDNEICAIVVLLCMDYFNDIDKQLHY